MSVRQRVMRAQVGNDGERADGLLIDALIRKGQTEKVGGERKKAKRQGQELPPEGAQQY